MMDRSHQPGEPGHADTHTGSIERIAMPQVAPILLNAEQAAAACGISRAHFLQLERSGRLGPQPLRLGRCVRWSRTELEAWAHAGCPPRREWQALWEARSR